MMADDWKQKVPKEVVALAGTVAVLAAGAAGWTMLGFPVPMTVEMHSEHHNREEVIESTRAALHFAQKVLDRQEEGTPEYTEAENYRDELQARLDLLTQ